MIIDNACTLCHRSATLLCCTCNQPLCEKHKVCPTCDDDAVETSTPPTYPERSHYLKVAPTRTRKLAKVG